MFLSIYFYQCIHYITCTTNSSCLIFGKYEYLIFSCIRFCNEYTSLFIEVTERGVDVETDELFYGDILSLIKGIWYSLLHSILTYWWSVDIDNISSMSTPSFNPVYSILDTLGIFTSLFFVEPMEFWLFASDRVWFYIKQCPPLTSPFSTSQSISLK